MTAQLDTAAPPGTTAGELADPPALTPRNPATSSEPAGFVRRHRLVLIALVLVLVFHGSLLLAGSYQRTYDAYVHIFFADHYRRSWFSSWDDRWYTGFSTLSYPPGGHQAIAALSTVIGLRAGFVAVQLFALLNLTVGVYRWSQIWVGRTSGGWAAILLVLSSSIAETVHVFGQLPTTLSLGFLLQALPFADRWVRVGDRKALLGGVACVMATTACHHVTTLFGAVFFLGPVLLSGIVAGLRQPRSDEPTGHPGRISRRLLWPLIARRMRRGLPAMTRAGVFGVLLLIALIAVVLPYWLYSRSDPIAQVSIPHASRDNYLVNVNAGLVFWLVPWGTTLLVLPYAFIRGMVSKAWPLTLSLGLLTLLGTGGTTPIPKLLLGGAYDILTLDRFTFWATISVLPMAGRFVSSIVRGTLRHFLAAQFGRTLAGVLPTGLLLCHLTFTLFAVNLTHYRPFQPATIDITPITTFLAKDDHSNWRYLTLGFGDQMAWLGANTTATTVDGNYHSARQLPELTSRPVERLEGAKYSGVPGIGSLQQFLAVPERYSLKYVFSNDDFYSPLLDSSGWTDLGPMGNGVEVWERADVPPLPVDTGSHQAPLWERLMWGIVPPGSILFALAVLAWAALGAPGNVSWLRRSLRPLRRVLAPVTGLAALVDRKLVASAAPLGSSGASVAVQERWVPWQPALAAIRRRAGGQIRERRRHRQAVIVVALLILLAGGGTAVLAKPSPSTPEEIVAAYYEHLDFRRFSDAYALLDPLTRPDFQQYQMDLGRDGGLVASFAKLSGVSTRTTASSAVREVMSTTLVFLTSLQSYQVRIEVTLLQEAGRWYIDLPAPDPTIPPDQFTSRADIDFLAQGRRAATSGATSTADVLDRPELALTDVKSLLVNQRWVVIGEVTNADVDPADVTVQAQLRAAEGELLASWDAGQVVLHKLMPGETSPFRIEFQSIAGIGDYGTEADGGVKDAASATTGGTVTVAPPTTVSSNLHGPVEFDPQTITPLVLAPGAVVASVGVYARAVVTPHSTTRGLQVLGVHLESLADGQYAIVGQLRNDTTIDASVPHLLLAYTAADGGLAWVDHAYLERSIGPQRTIDFRVVVADSSSIRSSGVQAVGYAGPSHVSTSLELNPMLALPADTGFAAVSVVATAYSRGN